MNEHDVARAASTFAELESQSLDALAVKLTAHRWWLEDYDRWSLEQDDGTLIIQTHARGESIVARAPAQIIGTFNTTDETWLWGWDNPSIQKSLKVDAEKVRQLGEQKSFDELTQRKLSTDREGALGLAAIAAHVCQSQGIFSAAAGETLVYISFGEVTLHKGEHTSTPSTRAPSPHTRLRILLIVLAALFFLPVIGAVIAIMLGH